ncbi:MAG: T9SS type A sorting domain-containing protein [Saprospiraceae bacterium]|nr:T9SS type A sorting domain-containing protein [Saprospiraceae bacterium]
MNNLKRFQIIVLFGLLNLSINAQITTTVINQNTIGGINEESLNAYKATSDGGFIVCGLSDSDISGDKTDSLRGSCDFWLLKLNADLTIKWQKTIGGSIYDSPSEVLLCDDGGYLCLGSSDSPISGEKTISSYGANDYWLIKLDSLGNIQWQKVYGGSGEERAISIIKMKNGNYIIGGYSDSDSSGVKSENSRGSWDYWIVCIDSIGNLLWDKTLGGSSWDIFSSFIKTFDNEILISGASASSVSGDRTAYHYGMGDIWLVKLDTTGNIIWNKSYGGNDNDGGGVILEKNNFFYIISSSESGISGVKSEVSRGDNDFWILKINKSGTIVWDKTIGGGLRDSPSSASFVDDNNILISGISNSPISGEKDEPWIGGFYDYWIVDIDTNSNLLWQKTIGGTGYESLCGAYIKNTNDFVLFGSSDSGISGHKTEASIGGYDYWIVEVSTNVGIQEHKIEKLNIFPNPSNGIINITFENQLETVNVKVYNQNAQLIYSGQITDYFSKIDLSEYPKGIYLIKLENKDFVKTEKIVIQ